MKRIITLCWLLTLLPFISQAQTITLNPVTSITITSATLSGTVNGGGFSNATLLVQLTTTNSITNALATYATIVVPNVESNLEFSVKAWGLTSNTTYYQYDTLTSSAFASRYATNTFFSYAVPMTGTTMSAINNTSAVFNASVNPVGRTTYVKFQYDTNSTLSTATVTTNYNIGNGSNYVSLTYPIYGLKYNTQYYYSIVASNNLVVSPTDTDAFTTPNYTLPISTNGSAAPGPTYATLYGAIVPNGATTYAWFLYGTNGNGLANQSGISSYGAGFNRIAISAAIYGLTNVTTYKYAVVSSNAAGVVVSSTNTFITTVAPTSPANYTYGGDQLRSVVAANPSQAEPGYVLGYAENQTRYSLLGFASVQHNLDGTHGTNWLQNYMIPDSSLSQAKIDASTQSNSVQGYMIPNGTITIDKLDSQAITNITSTPLPGAMTYITGVETNSDSVAFHYGSFGPLTIPPNNYSKILLEADFVINIPSGEAKPISDIIFGHLLGGVPYSITNYGFYKQLGNAAYIWPIRVDTSYSTVYPHTTLPARNTARWTIPGGQSTNTLVQFGFNVAFSQPSFNNSVVVGLNSFRAIGIK